MQQAVLSIVDNVSKLAISEKKSSDGVNCVIVLRATIGVPKTLLVEAEELAVNSVCTAFKPGLWEDRSFSRCNCGLLDAGIVLLDVVSCPCSLNRESTWKPRSCRVASFLPFYDSDVLWRIVVSNLSICILLRANILYTFPRWRGFLNSSSAYWDGIIPDSCAKLAISDSVSSMAPYVSYRFNMKAATCAVGGEVYSSNISRLACSLFSTFSTRCVLSTVEAVLFVKK